MPGSIEFKANQRSLQSPADTTDVVAVIKGVIDAENGAIEHYGKLIVILENTPPFAQESP